jgi:4-amino-4-deoxy-L-arabinose transferase-like glycosyltransferase
MSLSPRVAWSLCAILMVALAVRLGAAAWWGSRLPEDRKFGFPDSESYWALAQKVSRGEPYEFGSRHYKIFRTPGYPVLLAGLFRVVGNDDPPAFYARALGAVLGTASVAGVAALGGLLFGVRGALLSGSIAAVHPEAIAPSVFVLSEAPFCPLMVFQLVAWTTAWQASTWKAQSGWSFLAGVLGGLATLMRPSWLLFLPFAGVVGLLLGPARMKQVAVGGAMVAGLVCTMLPWWIRNYEVAGRLVPTSLQVGASLYDGLSPQADGGSNMDFVEPMTQRFEQAEAANGAGPGTFEDRVDRHFQNESVAWARANPGRVLELVAIKFRRMWSPWPNAAEFGSRKLAALLAVGFVPLAIAAIAGAVLFARRDWPYVLCLLPAVYFTLLHVIFVSSIRYRQPALLPLMVIASGAVLYFYDRWRGRMDSPAATDAIAGSTAS